MGTRFGVAIVTASTFDQTGLQEEIRATLEDIDQHFSTYRPDAELAGINRAESTEWLPVSPTLCKAVDDALLLSIATAGAFDITVGPLVNLWGFGPDPSRAAPPTDESIDEARSATGHERLHTDCSKPAIRKESSNLKIDLSGYAKGLAADEVANILDQQGMQNYLVEIGGDLRARGHNVRNEDWRIAIESPDQRGGTVEKIIHISDLSVATSGDYRNYFEHEGRRFSHTIDPRTGRPVTHELMSVTVLAPGAAFADAMATALMVLGLDAGSALAEQERIAAYFLYRDGSEVSEWMSTQFRAVTDR